MRIFWQDSMTMGVPSMDSDHRAMVGLLDQVCVALQHRNLPAAGRAFTAFLDAALAHFDNEERLIEQFSHEGGDRHMQVHETVRGVLARLGEALFDERDLAEAERLTGEIVNAWIRMLFTDDMVLAARLKAAWK